jgi:hypothetical protein
VPRPDAHFVPLEVDEVHGSEGPFGRESRSTILEARLLRRPGTSAAVLAGALGAAALRRARR